jgi:hypothetical protein
MRRQQQHIVPAIPGGELLIARLHLRRPTQAA